MARLYARLFAVAAVLSPLVALQVTVSNSLPRLDSDGNVIDCHSGNIVHVNSTFFMYGERYKNHTGIGRSPANILHRCKQRTPNVDDRRPFATSSVPPACRVHEASCYLGLIRCYWSTVAFFLRIHSMLRSLQPGPHDLDFSRTCPHNMAVVSIRHPVYAVGSL